MQRLLRWADWDVDEVRRPPRRPDGMVSLDDAGFIQQSLHGTGSASKAEAHIAHTRPFSLIRIFRPYLAVRT
jgi:hypothetical protein